MRRLLLLLMLLPLAELYVLMKLGGRIGGMATLLLIVSSGGIGALVVRAEGMRVLRSWQEAFGRGVAPADRILDSMLVFLGGVLLIVPGVISDAIGLLVLVPFTRRIVARIVARRLQRAIERGTIHIARPDIRTYVGRSEGVRPNRGVIIDAEGESVPPAPPRARLPADSS